MCCDDTVVRRLELNTYSNLYSDPTIVVGRYGFYVAYDAIAWALHFDFPRLCVTHVSKKNGGVDIAC